MNTQIQIVEQKTVVFYQSDLIAARAEDGRVYVVISSVCNSLGLNPNSQRRRIQQHDVLSSGYVSGPVETAGGEQSMGMIRVDYVPLWLTTLRVASVSPEHQDKLRHFQKEAAQALWEAFQEGRLTSDPGLEELLAGGQQSEAVEAYKMLQALVKLARNQIVLEAQVGDHERRLEEIEATLGDTGHMVTPDQAMQISQAVKAVALELGKKSGKNEFGGVYGEFYRRFSITSYKMLPKYQFEKAMEFLGNWYQSLTNSKSPF